MSIQELSKSLVGDVRSVLEGKKLDPVGKADDDIDNDGDVDSSDEYLHKRRQAIKKAMAELITCDCFNSQRELISLNVIKAFGET